MGNGLPETKLYFSMPIKASLPPDQLQFLFPNYSFIHSIYVLELLSFLHAHMSAESKLQDYKL